MLLREYLLWLFHLPAFRSVYMITLSVGGGADLGRRQFGGPGEAYDWISKRRLVSEVMRRLGFSDWVAVLEFQKRGWPHWHVAVPGYVDLSLLRSLWRDKWGLGEVHVAAPQGFCKAQAAGYLTKYLSKDASSGLPEWVVARKTVRGVACSRSLMGFSAWLRHWVKGAWVVERGRDEVRVVRVSGSRRASLGDRLRRCGSGSRGEFVGGGREAPEYISGRLPSADVLVRVARRVGVPCSPIFRFLSRPGSGFAFDPCERDLVLRELGSDRELTGRVVPATRSRVFVSEVLFTLTDWLALEASVPSLRVRMSVGGLKGGGGLAKTRPDSGRPSGPPPPLGCGAVPHHYPPASVQSADSVAAAPSPIASRAVGGLGGTPPKPSWGRA